MTFSWAQLSNEELLKWRICDLALDIPHSPLAEYVDQLYRELESKEVRIRPKVYLGDEWFSPEGMVAIAVPFYLAHPRLVDLERSMMLEVEGDRPDYFMKLIRHESGHCFDHAYSLSRKSAWREVFGSPDEEYDPDTYRPRPYSKSYVRNLENWYAQSHPDEDFAETFAVWLDPERSWKKEYAKWPIALRKLEYIDRQVKRRRNQEPGGVKGYLPYSAARMTRTLEKYYTERRRGMAEDYPDFYDGDLKRIFNGDPSLPKREFSAERFMKRHRKLLVSSVSYWTGERKFPINRMLKRLTARCASLDLRVGTDPVETKFEIAVYLATLVTHYLFTGRFKRNI